MMVAFGTGGANDTAFQKFLFRLLGENVGMVGAEFQRRVIAYPCFHLKNLSLI